MVELFQPATKSKTAEPEYIPNPEYMALANYLVANAPKHLSEDPVCVGIILLRVSLSRLFFRDAQEANV